MFLQTVTLKRKAYKINLGAKGHVSQARGLIAVFRGKARVVGRKCHMRVNGKPPYLTASILVGFSGREHVLFAFKFLTIKLTDTISGRCLADVLH